jgi:outer membrane protein W
MLYGGTSSKTSRITYDFTDKEMKFKFTPLTLDLRYFIMKNRKLDVFAGAGLNYYPFEDQNVIEDVKDNAMGFNFLGGVYYKLTGKLALRFMLRFNFVKKEIEGADNDLNMNSAELLFGLSVRL